MAETALRQQPNSLIQPISISHFTMAERNHSVNNVFGITRDLPLNYVTREDVDSKLIDNLSRDKHIVIYGSSKQGKTCLRKHCLEKDDYIVVQCNNRWELSNIHSSILKRAGYEITLSEKKTSSGKQKIVASLSAKLFGVDAKAGAELEEEEIDEKDTRELELDPEDVNDIIRALQSIEFSQFIVLEDFHYLPIETQKDFAVALKAFHEASNLSFIVVGVWLEENRLIVQNGDLTGRVIAVNADKWEDHELFDVIRDGEALLNISIADEFKQELVSNSFDSVYIVQESCREVCTREEVWSTQEHLTSVAQESSARDIISHVVNQQSARYRSFLFNFAEGFQETRLEMYRWILYPIITSEIEEVENGLSYGYIRRRIQEEHPVGQELNPGNLTQALQSTASLQVGKDIKPIILDYDQTNRRLSVVDRGFLIWLANQDQHDTLESTGLTKYID